jgi:hypothetical protein
MSDYMRELSTAAQAWSDSFDQGSAGIEMVDLVLEDHYDEEPRLALPLRELVSTELRYLLAVDAAARTASRPVARGRHSPEDGEVLRYAATRLELLTNGGGELAAEGVDQGWPGPAADVLAEAVRASEALAGLITYAVGRVTTNLSEGGLVALPGEGAKSMPNQAAVAEEHMSSAVDIAAQLDRASSQILALSSAIARLQHTGTAAALGAKPDDGPTLDTEAVLEYRLPGKSNTARFHVRVFRPTVGQPVVILGDMADNHSDSITNSVEAGTWPITTPTRSPTASRKSPPRSPNSFSTAPLTTQSPGFSFTRTGSTPVPRPDWSSASLSPNPSAARAGEHSDPMTLRT